MPTLPPRRRLVLGSVLACAAAALGAAPASRALAVGSEAATAEGAARLKVAFVGDSMADGFWGAFVRTLTRDKCLKERLEGGRYAKNGTGLTRTDSYDWAAQMRKIVETYQPSAVVASIGLNDRQDVVEPGGRATYGTPRWETAYKARVVSFLEAANSSGAGVLLVGLPAMRDATVQTDAQAKNRIFAEAASAVGKPNVVYVEPWHPPSAPPGVFKSASPAENGRGLVQVRAADGIHFTAAGYDMLMAYLFPKLASHLPAEARDIGAECQGS